MHCAVKSTLRQNVVNVICIIMRNVLTRTPVGRRLIIELPCLFNLSKQIWWNKVAKVIRICFSCSMLCMDGLLLHLVGKRQLLVYSGAPYGNGKLEDSIGKVIIKVARRARVGPKKTPAVIPDPLPPGAKSCDALPVGECLPRLLLNNSLLIALNSSPSFRRV